MSLLSIKKQAELFDKMNEGDLFSYGAPFKSLDPDLLIDWYLLERVKKDDGTQRLIIHGYLLDVLVCVGELNVDKEGSYEWKKSKLRAMGA
jgi:hypothetical protein